MRSRDIWEEYDSSQQSSFTKLYNRYYPIVFRTAYFFLRNRDATLDVVSDVFLAMWKSKKAQSDIQTMSAYLYIITRNEAIRYLKKERKVDYISIQDFTTAHMDEFSVPFQTNIDIVTFEHELDNIINTFPTKCREIFILKRMEGLSTAEIASKLNISESTVRVQLKYAVDRIKARFSTHYDWKLTLILLMLGDATDYLG